MDAWTQTRSFPETRLAAGQALHLNVPAGTMLVARAGRLRVDGPPRWLGERMVVTGRSLNEGEAHVVDVAGWVVIAAPDAQGALLQRIDPATPRRPWVGLRALVRTRSAAATSR